jgi:hypothetical protein
MWWVQVNGMEVGGLHLRQHKAEGLGVAHMAPLVLPLLLSWSLTYSPLHLCHSYPSLEPPACRGVVHLFAVSLVLAVNEVQFVFGRVSNSDHFRLQLRFSL